MNRDISIRSALASEAEILGRLVVDTWRETYSVIFPQDFFESFTYENQISRAATLLADSSSPSRPALAVTKTGQAIGFAFAGHNRNSSIASDSELYTLYLLKTFHGLGVGKRLLEFVAGKELERGRKPFIVYLGRGIQSDPRLL
jgi:GNAT superfamily N-acetyltransferase